VTDLPQSDPREEDSQTRGFVPDVLDRSVISVPLLEILAKKAPKKDPQHVIIDVNLVYTGGEDQARQRVRDLIDEAIRRVGTRGLSWQKVHDKSESSRQYVYATLEGDVIRELARLDTESATDKLGHIALTRRVVHRIWPDFPVKALINRSISTVKADAARIAFGALGGDVVWAVADSGIDEGHGHFKDYKNLKLKDPLQHQDFTGAADPRPLSDGFGHGTHVAGIIAGSMRAKRNRPIKAFSRHRDEMGLITREPEDLEMISGMAPSTSLLSLKVLDEDGMGLASNLIAAIEYIQQVNGYGRWLHVHGLNMSVGYEFEPEWFACGQSPLCVEVDRLVRSGVVVVVAAGNTGYGWNQTKMKGTVPAGLDLTINDPGNAELAITVGSTHREMPHVYGVSYFSSKGPTGDGRLKPDLLAPGEKIVSCAAGTERLKDFPAGLESFYMEDSGTSMAAPHVSGVIAAFLSVRREFIGRPEQVKEIFLESATDLRRDRAFQGKGLVDLMRAIQSV
jgi:subtilisin family serine protease